MGRTGIYTFSNVTNDLPYFLTLSPMNGSDQGGYSDPLAVTPKADPDPPSGWVLINDGAERATSRFVMLNISATDEPLPGAAESANAHYLGGELALRYNLSTPPVEMRISNDPTMAGAAWEPLASEKIWVLGTPVDEVFRVYAQFRDGADNESLIVFDEILVFEVSLPLIRK
jgi:hypothetical protein